MDAEARKRAKDEGLRIAERLNELGVDVYCAHADTGAMVEETANRLSTGCLRSTATSRNGSPATGGIAGTRRATSPRPMTT
jgi:hypothetical protein